MIYQHPLGYLLGIEGLALLRAWAGDYDEAFVRARLAEVRRLLDEPAVADHAGVAVLRGGTPAAYRRWSATYDEPRNALFDVDEPVMHEILDPLPPGTVLDAACGTGRYAARMAARGHRVLGLDSSPEMLQRARARVPQGTFLRGELHRLPVADHTVDVVVCALALVHVRSPAPVMAEFARVLRPGGHLAISDVHRDWRCWVRSSTVPARRASRAWLRPTGTAPVTTCARRCRRACGSCAARNPDPRRPASRRRRRRRSPWASGRTGPGACCRSSPPRPALPGTRRPPPSGTSSSTSPEARSPG
ncbi:MAG TPA: class I SAM-dependent methyltransferase [Mycobacteriales bacterium]